MVYLRSGLYCLRPLICDFLMAIWRICIIGAKMAISVFLGLSGLFRNGLDQFEHPYILNIHGSVLFCRDCWEEEGGCRGWDLGEGGIGTASLRKGKKSSVLLAPMVPNVGLEADGGYILDIFGEILRFSGCILVSFVM